MRVVTFGCNSKFRDGRTECRLGPDRQGTLGDIPVDAEPLLALWHGNYGDGIRDFLSASSVRYVLLVGQGLSEINDQSFPGNLFPGRLRSFSLEDVPHWLDHLPWKRTALTRFFKTVTREGVTVPPWTLLIPPVAPEHVIACYLCSIAALEPEASWAKGFEEEVSYWTRERKVHLALGWNQDRTDKEKLRAFLAAVGARQISKEPSGQ
jgi:hypothetical protein